MEQLYRDQFAHYIDTGTSEAPNYVLEGIGVNSLALSYNPQVAQEKTIIQRTADASFDGYQIQASISDKRIHKGDAMWDFLNEARRHAKAVETKMLEVEMATGTGTPTPSYNATEFNVLIVITEFLGENATIGYDIYVKGDPTVGSATIADSKPAFTPEV